MVQLGAAGARHGQLVGAGLTGSQVGLDKVSWHFGPTEGVVHQHVRRRMAAEQDQGGLRLAQLGPADCTVLEVLLEIAALSRVQGAVQVPGHQLGGMLAVHLGFLPARLGVARRISLHPVLRRPIAEKTATYLQGFLSAAHDTHP